MSGTPFIQEEWEIIQRKVKYDIKCEISEPEEVFCRLWFKNMLESY